jgi:hypothetical protein
LSGVFEDHPGTPFPPALSLDSVFRPVKAMAVASQAYSYYKPEIKGETLSKAIPVQ